MVVIEETVSQPQVEANVEEDMVDDSLENKEEALACLKEGKRNLLCKDIPAAVSCLADACKLMSAECGEKAPECGETYYFYGKALLELARLENVVLGNALTGVPKEDAYDGSTQIEDPDLMTDEERIEIEEKVDLALVENLENCQLAENPLLMKEVANVDEQVANEDVAGSPSKKGSDVPITELDDKVVEEDDEDSDEDDCEHLDEENADVHIAEAEEDPSNLQLAWEVLELSKIICKEQLDTKKELSTETKAALEKRYCDTYLLLSEVSVESGNYYQAVGDLKLCLERQKTLLPADSRNIAGTLYHLGVALGFYKNYDEALMSLDASVSVLTNRMANLEGKAGTQLKNEATEIKALIPEVRAKIVDIKDIKEEADRKAVEFYKIGGKTVNDKPVSTIPVKKVAAM